MITMTTQWREFFADNNILVEKGDYDRAYDVNEKPFVTVTSSGPKASGEWVGAIFFTEELAWRAFEHHILVWLAGRRRLHLRTAPVMHEEIFQQFYQTLEPITTKWYWVGCRLTAY